MIRKISLPGRVAAVAPVLGLGLLAAMSSPRDARAQEKKCYIMVCDGRACVAYQMVGHPTILVSWAWQA